MAIMMGTPGDDNIPRGSATLDGGGNVSYEVDDQIFGLTGNDVIADGAGNNMLYGAAGDDNLTTGHGTDTIYGGVGNDFLSGGSGNDFLYGGTGNDFIWVLNGNGNTGGGSDLVEGGAGNDHVQLDEYGLSTGATITGGAGTDRLQIKLGGFYHPDNTYDRTPYLVDLSLMWTGGVGIVGGSTVTSFETLNGIQGGGGNDRIIIGTDYTASTNQLINGVLAQNYFRGWDGDDYISGGSGGDNITGDNGNDTLIGNRGNDALDGSAGDDLLNGGAGNDVLYGGAGADTVLGGSGNDFMYGMEGENTLDGGTGNDTMNGGVLNDVFVVDSFQDIVGDPGGIDTISTGLDYSLNVWPLMVTIENLVLTGAAISGTGNALDNALTGNGLANLLTGLDGRDTLLGGSGDDTLKGGLGADLMNGGTGADTFVFDTLQSNAQKDRILGFVHGSDKIALDHAVFTALTVGALDPAAFGLGAAASPDQHVIYDATTGALSYDLGGQGGARGVVLALLVGAPALDASDFLVI